MEFFTKTVTTDKISEALVGFFDAGYGALVVAFKERFKEDVVIISKDKDQELIIVPMIAILKAVIAVFGDTAESK